MTARPLSDGPDRQATQGGAMLAALEAEALGDDPVIRGQLHELAELLHGWDTAAQQALAVRLRLLAPDGEGYVPADLDAALVDYRFARGLVLNQITTIHDHQETR